MGLGRRGGVLAGSLAVLALALLAATWSARGGQERPAARLGDPGTVYVSASDKSGSVRGTLLALDPTGARLGATSMDGIANELVLAPPGTPDEGEVYATGVRRRGDALFVIDPSAGRVREIPVDGQLEALVVAPSGSPGAGTVYAPTLDRGQLFALAPGATNAEKITVTPYATHVDVAPAGTPNAGTLIVSDEPDRLVTVLLPGERRLLARARLPNRAGAPFVAPAGTPRAGTVYVPVSDWDGDGPGRIAALPPEGAPVRYLTVGTAPYRVFVVPAGLPGAGTLYVFDGKTLWMLDPVSEETIGRVRLPTGPTVVAIVPAGSPGAGTLYLAGTLDGLDGLLMVLEPGSEQVRTLPVSKVPEHLVVAPTGTPAAGTAYLTTVLGGDLSILPPGADSVKTVHLGDYAQGIVVVPAR